MPEDPRFIDDSSQAASEEKRLEKDSVQTPDESKYKDGRELIPNEGITNYEDSKISPLEELRPQLGADIRRGEDSAHKALFKILF